MKCRRKVIIEYYEICIAVVGYLISSSLHAALNNLIVVLSAIGQATTQGRGRRWEYKDGDGGVYKRLNLPRALPVNL